MSQNIFCITSSAELPPLPKGDIGLQKAIVGLARPKRRMMSATTTKAKWPGLGGQACNGRREEGKPTTGEKWERGL